MVFEGGTFALTKLLLALLLAAPASAKVEAVRLSDFSGGINDHDDPTKVAANESPGAQNMVIDEGSLKPRKGVTLCGDPLPSGNVGKSAFPYAKSDGSERIIVSDNENYYDTPDCTNYTRFKDGEDSNAIADYAIVRNKLWVLNRATHPFTWDGSTTTLLDGRANTPSPAPPRASYIEFWKERVFLGRTISDPAGIAFSDITDSAGNDIDPSTGTAAFPATNVIQVGQESEGPLYALHVYRDRLYAFKQDAIYRINFNSRFDISVERVASNVGTRYDKSIEEIDGLLYFTGPLGVYAFNGDEVVRLSEKFDNKFGTLRQPNNDESFKSWSLASDFDDGTQLQISTTQINGSIEIENSLDEDWNDGTADLDDINSVFFEWTEHDGASGFSEDVKTDGAGTSVGWFVSAGESGDRYSAFSATPSYQSTNETGIQFDLDLVPGNPSNQIVWVQFVSNGGNHNPGLEVGYALKLALEDAEVGIYRTDGGTVDVPILVLIASMTPSGTHTEFEKTWQVTWATDGDIFVSTNGVQFLTGNDTTYSSSTAISFWSQYNKGAAQSYWEVGIDNVEVQESTGSWISDKFNAVSVSSWTRFDTTQNSNGGTILWQYRAASSEGGLDSASWNSITPGVTPNIVNTNTWIQFQSSFTASSENFGKTPEVQDVTQNYSQGDFVSQPIYAGYIDKRYWVTAASGAASNNNIAMVRSRGNTNAWMFYDLQINDLFKYQDNYYALASTHSAIYRLEDGENDNGEAIHWHYETGDIEWGAPWVRKELLKLTVEFRGDDAANSKIGWSRDSGSTWGESDLDMSAAGRDSKTFFINGGNAFDFRFRVRNSTLDEDASILGITGWANKFEVLE